MTSDDASIAHLRLRLALIEARVRAAVARRRAGDPDPDDRFRGLYVSEAEVDRLLFSFTPDHGFAPPDQEAAAFLERVEEEADEAERGGADLRLRRLARSFELDEQDIELLLIALAPDLDPRFERLYAYLHDDVSRRRASAGLALELCSGTVVAEVDRRRLGPAGTLVSGRLVLVEDLDRPFLTRSLRVPDRVAAHLLGDDTPDPMVTSLLMSWADVDIGDIAYLERSLRRGTRLAYVRERMGAAGISHSAAAMARAGLPAVVLDLLRLGPDDDVKEVAAAGIREAGLRSGGLVAGPIDALAERGQSIVRAFCEASCPVVLVGVRTWDPAWSIEVPLLIDAPLPTPGERASIWRAALNGGAQPDLEPSRSTAQFRLTPEQVFRAARAARRQAEAGDRSLGPEDLRAGARAQNAAGLERLARRIVPQVEWEDLVLPPQVVVQLRELAARARHREQVLDEWGMGAKSSKGRGITALFAGESGTGKTISAEVVAGALGLDLYVIDLSTVVDKYIGETEKNLDRIFTEADRVNGVLLFDEADAIFGKRSEVKDARDRYANVEVAYLLQRIEVFDGLAVLTTNLRANVDESFTRRLDVVVDFPMPEEDARLQLWYKHLRPGVPRTEDVDLGFLARAFKLSGGNISNVAVAAAYLAADEDRAMAMADLIHATEREYRKLGRLCTQSEFGPYYELVAVGSLA